MIYKVCDFNVNGRYRLWSSQPVRLNKVTLDALGIQSAASLCFKHYWQPQENTMVQGPLRTMEPTHTHTCTCTKTHLCINCCGLIWVVLCLLQGLYHWISLWCSLSSGSSRFAYTQPPVWTPLWWDYSHWDFCCVFFFLFVHVFWCDTLLILWMREDRCLCVFLCVYVGLCEKFFTKWIYFKNAIYYHILSEFMEITQQWLKEMQIIRLSALFTHSAEWNVQPKKLTASH